MSIQEYDEASTEEITNLLMGRTVKKVSDEKLELDDGTMLTLVGNDGGCSCGGGDYALEELNGCDNVITRVELQGEDGLYEIFVYADNARINLARFVGDDGSGYYGTGYTITVERPTTTTP